MKKYSFILSLFVLYVIVNMVLSPELYIKQTLNGITAWAFNVLPSVLPFMLLTKILSSLGEIEKFSKIFSKPSSKLFKTPAISSYVFFISILSGYPVGAKMTADLYETGKISKSDAFKMTSFCSTSGPMFIIGAVGIGMLKNVTYGYIIMIAHIVGALLNGLLYRSIKIKSNTPALKNKESKNNIDLSGIVLDSALSIISVGTIIAIFFVIITSLSPIFSLFPSHITGILEGIIEITKGCYDISSSLNGIWAVVACTFVISFGGISTILQSITMLNKLDMPIKLFVLQKFTHAVFATIISIILLFIFF